MYVACLSSGVRARSWRIVVRGSACEAASCTSRQAACRGRRPGGAMTIRVLIADARWSEETSDELLGSIGPGWYASLGRMLSETAGPAWPGGPRAGGPADPVVALPPLPCPAGP